MATRIKPEAKSIYDQDFYVWTEVQAELLRQRRFEALDLDNLIEEVEGLGDSKKSAVLSDATVVIEHLLKLQHSPATDPRAGWVDWSSSTVTGWSTTSRRACGRSSRTSYRASTRSRGAPPSVGCACMVRIPRRPRCLRPVPTPSTRSSTTGGREPGTVRTADPAPGRVRPTPTASSNWPKHRPRPRWRASS